MYLTKVTKYLYFVTFHHWISINILCIVVQTGTY